MKILIINHGAFPYPGGNGCSVQLNSIIQSFYKNGHELFLFNINTNFPIKDITQVEQHIQSYCKNVIHDFGTDKCGVFMPMSIIKKIWFTLLPNDKEFYNGYDFRQEVDEIIFNWKPDLIFAYSVNAFTAYDYKKHKIPYAISVVDLEYLVFKYKYLVKNNLGIKAKLRKLDSYFLYNRSKSTIKPLILAIKNAIVCFEHAKHHQQELINRSGRQNIYYFPVNVEEPAVSTPLNKTPSSKIRIGLVGNVTGIATLQGLKDFFEHYLDPLSKVKFFDNLEFYIIGGGELNAKYTTLISKFNNITRIGFVEHVYDIYKMLDIVLVPTSIPLGFRTRIVESFSYETCVISHQANVDAMPEFKHLKNGLAYQNSKDLIKCFNLIINDRELINTLSLEAKNTYNRSLKGEIVGNKMIELINQKLSIK
jgi:hypothetical protein